MTNYEARIPRDRDRFTNQLRMANDECTHVVGGSYVSSKFVGLMIRPFQGRKDYCDYDHGLSPAAMHIEPLRGYSPAIIGTILFGVGA